MKTPEFIAMMGMMFATIAFSIDSMLPALPEIARELTPGDINRAQLVLTAFVLGLGIGTFFTGPLSDAMGRKPVIIWGAGLYVIGAAWAVQAQTLETLLAARVIQGLGASGGRVVSLAVLRDLYSGREMARITAFVMMIFTVFPAFAPMIGAGIIHLSSWRGIFIAFILFAAVSVGWFALRQPETLPPERRRPLSPAAIGAALKELAGMPLVRISVLVQAAVFCMVFATLASVQQIYEITYDEKAIFPYIFALVAAFAATSSFINGKVVMVYGMRKVAIWAFAVLLALTLVALWAVRLPGIVGFVCFVAWQVAVFFKVGFTIGNVQAMAMEKVGHIAGVAASLLQSVATVLAAAVAVPIGLAFDGTPLPLMLGVAALCLAGLALLLWLRRIEAPA